MAQTIVAVTGTSRGIGLHLVKELLSRKTYKVFATCRRPEQADELQALAKKHSDVLSLLPLEVTEENSVAKAVDEVSKHTKHVDILINNAGVASKNHPKDPILEAEVEEMLRVYKINVCGPLLVTQKFYSLLKASAGARVVNISSTLGSIEQNTTGGVCSYRASKAALNQLTRTFAMECKDAIFTAVHPGWVQTDMGNAGNRTAAITPEESTKGIVDVIESLTDKENGALLSYDGSTLPW